MSSTPHALMPTQAVLKRRTAPLNTPTALRDDDVNVIAGALNALLADVYVLYLKTKNFHWHLSGVHFRDLHTLLDEQAAELLAMTDPLAERNRMLGAGTLRSIGHIARLQRLSDNDAAFVEPQDMLAELRDDHQQMSLQLRGAHAMCNELRDIGTADLIGRWLAESEKRTWFLFEATRASHGPRTTLAN